MLTSVLVLHGTEIPHKHLQKYFLTHLPFSGMSAINFSTTFVDQQELILVLFLLLMIIFCLITGPSTLQEENCLFVLCFF